MSKNETYIKEFQKLIRKETVSSRANKDLTKFYEFHDILREVFPRTFQTCEFHDFNGSVLLRWPGRDGAKPPIMFMNHHDVVEATGVWKHPPFSGEVAEGKIWGRGTFDTKGGLYCMLRACEELIGEGFMPAQDIYFESTCNEENTQEGAAAIAAYFKNAGIHLAASFDEGNCMREEPIAGAKGLFALVGLGEKGCAEMKFIARSAGGHASIPPKNTPLVRLGRFMAEVEDTVVFERKISPVMEEFFRRIEPFMTDKTLIPRDVENDATWEKLEPSVKAMLATTLAFTMAHGSEGANVLPQEAYVVGNMRFSHHEGREKAVDKLRPIADKYGIEIDVYDPGFISTISDYRGPAFKTVERATKEIFPAVDEVLPFVLTGASDSSFNGEICDQCIRFSPFIADAAQMAGMHGLDEHIKADSLEPAVEFYKFIMREYK
ncbi:MAG: M20/M25/M40 family metallo-hydrolase [Firmicutes bacterium]|nr:M20/M25/M40 family metallo-hydrolase [Bacillota bacterium]